MEINDIVEIVNDKIRFHCLLKHRVTALRIRIVLIFKVFEPFVGIL